MLVDHAKQIAYTLCNELWKLKLQAKIQYLGKSNETGSIQFYLAKELYAELESVLFAVVQYNKIQSNDIGYVTLRFYNSALQVTKTLNIVQHAQDRTNSMSHFAKYAKGNKGRDGEEYCEFQFPQLIDGETLYDIKKFLRIIDRKLENAFGHRYLLCKLPSDIHRLPT